MSDTRSDCTTPGDGDSREQRAPEARCSCRCLTEGSLGCTATGGCASCQPPGLQTRLGVASAAYLPKLITLSHCQHLVCDIYLVCGIERSLVRVVSLQTCIGRIRLPAARGWLKGNADLPCYPTYKLSSLKPVNLHSPFDTPQISSQN